MGLRIKLPYITKLCKLIGFTRIFRDELKKVLFSVEILNKLVFTAAYKCFVVSSQPFNFEYVDLDSFRTTFYITKTRLFKYIENFTAKKGKFSDKNSDIFHIFFWKHKLWVLVRTALERRF